MEEMHGARDQETVQSFPRPPGVPCTLPAPPLALTPGAL